LGEEIFFDFRDGYYPDDFTIDNPLSSVIGGNDFGIKFNCSTLKFFYTNSTPYIASEWTIIGEKEIINMGKIKSILYSPLTSIFPNFWKNCLILIESETNHPRLVWGKHPTFEATDYRIYRAISNTSAPTKLNYILIDSTSSNVFEYFDEGIQLTDNQYVFYYVAAYNSLLNQNSELTNLVCTKEISNSRNATLLLETTTGINPHLYWGRHPTYSTTNYKVCRAISHVPNPRSITYNLIHTTTTAEEHSYLDEDLRLGDTDFVFYQVKAFDSNTNSTSESSNVVTTIAAMYKSSTEEIRNRIEYSLAQNQPNPFNPTTSIKYSLPEQQFVSLKIFDILGKEVATLVNEIKPAGNYEVNFDASNLSSGVYFYQLRAGNFTEMKKMILIK